LSTSTGQQQQHQNEDATDLVDFGYERVATESKQLRVNSVFDKVARNYDLMNDLMSAGLHRLWKDVLVDCAGPVPGQACLDMAGGTGDVAFRLVQYAQREGARARHTTASDSCRVTVSDINVAMMEVGQRRAVELGLDVHLSWQEANAESLPFADNSFDLYTIAFGYRNCTNLDAVAREATRVLRPGGRFLCLEFSRPQGVAPWLVTDAYEAYSMNVIPAIGQLAVGDWDSYQYLVESIRRFPDQAGLSAILRAAGLQHVTHENLTGGVVAIHSGFKLPPLAPSPVVA